VGNHRRNDCPNDKPFVGASVKITLRCPLRASHRDNNTEAQKAKN